MPLVYCPECGARISDRAVTCPHCGFTASTGVDIVPISTLPPTEKPIRPIIPELAIFDDGSDLVSVREGSKLGSFLKSVDMMQEFAPSVYNAIRQMAAQGKTAWVADFSAMAERLMKEGRLVLGIDSKTGEFLPQLRDVKTGEIYEQVRLRAKKLPSDVAPSFAMLQLQASMAEISKEIELVAEKVEQLRLEQQGDRIARAKAVWMRLQQAMLMQDARLRESKISSIADDATEQRCVLQENYRVKCNFAAEKKGKVADWGTAAHEAIVNLTVISLMVRTEYAACMLLDEPESAKAALGQFKGFVMENELDNPEVLAKLNSRSKENCSEATDEFAKIAGNMATLELGTGIETKGLLERSKERHD